MNQQLIEQLRNGEISVFADGTMEQICRVIKEAFPNDTAKPQLNLHHYFKSRRAGEWSFIKTCSIPSISVADFFKEEDFKWGEDVEVSDGGDDWRPAVYGCRVPEHRGHFKDGYKHIALTGGVNPWKFCRRPQVKEITLAEVAEKFGTTPDKIRIV